VVGCAVVGADARIVGTSLVARGRVSSVLLIGLDLGGAGKDSYSFMTLSCVGDGAESRTERSESLYTVGLGVSAREASNIFAPRTIGRFFPSLSGVAVGDGMGMPYREYSESECSCLKSSRSLVMERERLGRCHATELAGCCTTGDEGSGTEYDRLWLTGVGCSDVTGEILTSGTGFKFSVVGRRGGAGLTSVALIND